MFCNANLGTFDEKLVDRLTDAASTAVVLLLTATALPACGNTGSKFEVSATGEPTEGSAPLEVQFQGTATHKGDDVENIDGRKIDEISYKWERQGKVLGKKRNLEHRFDEPGEYLVGFEVEVSRSGTITGATDWFGRDTVEVKVTESK